MMKNDNTFKSTYELMDDLAKVWHDLSDIQQANIIELVAGKRQGNIVVSMLNNWKDAQDALNSALNSQGSAMRENARYLDSIEAKSKQFINVLEKFWQAAIDSRSIKNLIDMATGFINVLAKLAKTGHMFPAIFAGIGMLLLSFTQKGQVLTEQIKLFNVEGKKLSKVSITLAGGFKGLEMGAKASALAVRGLNFALNTLLPVALLSGIVFVIGKIVNMGKEADKAKKSIQELAITVQQLEVEITETGELVDEYDYLTEKINKTVEEKQKLADVTEQLAAKYPEIVESYRDENGQLKITRDYLEEIIELRKEQQRAGRLEIAFDFASDTDRSGLDAIFDVAAHRFRSPIAGFVPFAPKGFGGPKDIASFYKGIDRELYKEIDKDLRHEIESYRMWGDMQKINEYLQKLERQKLDIITRLKAEGKDTTKATEDYLQIKTAIAQFKALAKEGKVEAISDAVVYLTEVHKTDKEIATILAETIASSYDVIDSTYKDIVDKLAVEDNFANYADQYLSILNKIREVEDDTSISTEEKAEKLTKLNNDLNKVIINTQKELPEILVNIGVKSDNIEGLTGQITDGLKENLKDREIDILNVESTLEKLSSKEFKQIAKIPFDSKEPEGYVKQVQEYFKQNHPDLPVEIEISGEDLSNTIQKVAQQFNYKDIAGQFKETRSNIEQFQNILDSLNTKGFTEEVKAMAMEHGELIVAAMSGSNELREAIEENIAQHKETFSNLLYDKLSRNKDFYNNVIKGDKEFHKIMHEFGIDSLKGFQNIADAQEAIVQNLLGKLGLEWADYYDMTTGQWTEEYDKLLNIQNTGIPVPIVDKKLKALQKTKEALEKLKEWAAKRANIDIPFPSKSGASKASKASKEVSKHFEVWKEGLDSLIREYEILKNQLDDVTSFEHKTEIYDKMVKNIEAQHKYLLSISKTFELNLKQAESHLRSFIGKGLSESDFAKIISGSTDTIEINIKNEKAIKAIEDFKKLSDSINNVKKEIMGLDNEMRNLSFEKFRLILSDQEEKVSDLEQAKSNLRNEMSLLEKGSKDYIALLEQENKVNIQLKDNIIHRAMLVQQELKSDKWNVEQKKELINVLKQLKQEYVDLQFSIKQQLATVADDIISVYKEVYEKQKQVALNAIDEQIKAEGKRHDRAMKNLDDEISKVEDLINAKLKALDRDEDERSYQKELEKRQKTRQETIDKISLLSMDDSIEAKMQLADLHEKLAEQEEEIEEMKHGHSLDLRKKNLKDQLDKYKKDVSEKKKAEDTKYNLEKNRLEKVKKETEQYYNNMINNERKFAQIRTNIINGNIDEVKSALSSFTSFVNGNFEFIGSSISMNIITKMQQLIALMESVNNQRMLVPDVPDTYFSPPTGPIATIDTTGREFYNDKVIIPSREIAGILGVSVDWSGYGDNQRVTVGGKTFKPVKNVDGTTYLGIREVAEALGHTVEWDDINRKIKIYHSGGVVGDNSFGFVDKIHKFFNTNANEHVIKALTNEVLVPPQNIGKYLIPNMQKLVSNIAPQPQLVSGGDNNYYLKMNIEKIIGDKKGGETVFKEIVRGLKSI